MARRRLLYVLNDVDYFLLHWLERTVAAGDRGFDVHLAAPPFGDVDRVRDSGLTFHPIDLARESTNVIKEMRAVREIARVHREVRPHLAHHATIKPVIYGGLAARRTRVPAVVSTIPGLGYLFASSEGRARILHVLAKQGYRRALSRDVSRVIFENSDDLADFERWRIIGPGKGMVIRGAGVDTSVFREAPEPDGPVRVVMASRLIWDKGVAEFIAAARIAKEAGVDARFILVGDTDPGNPAAVPTAQLEEWHREGVVKWLGRRADMPEVLRQAHIVCLPTSYREGVPRILIEAASTGRPIITTDSPGCRDIVRNGENGILVPLRDPDAIVDAVRRMCMDPGLRRSMGRRGRVIVETEFAREIVFEALFQLYDDLLDRCATTPSG
jgi:glycosyltransferase involved in cell wall biosynthesis